MAVRHRGGALRHLALRAGAQVEASVARRHSGAAPCWKAARRAALRHWEEGLRNGFPAGDAFGAEVAEMMARRGIRAEWLLEIIEGCAMDLEPRTFQGWDELSQSALLFGARFNEATRGFDSQPHNSWQSVLEN